MQTVTKVNSNMWRRAQSGLYAPSRRKFPINGLVFYAPLWHPELNTSPFISKDLNAHSCDVTGTTWGIQGRTFDGTNDNIILPANWMPATGTIVLWIKLNLTIAGYWFSCDINELSLYHFASGNLQVYYDGAYRINKAPNWTTNTFVHIAFTYARNSTGYLYSNGAQLDTGVIPDTAFTNVAARIGEGTDGSGDFTGTIGDFWVYNRVLTPTEILHSYNSTKWRYV